MSEKRESRFTPAAGWPIDLEQRAGESPTITGFAAIYYDQTPDTEYELGPGVVERIRPGAFSGLLKEGTDTMALFNHDPNKVLGRTPDTLKLKSMRKGLHYDIAPADTPTGREVVANISAGNIRGSSFAFTIAEEKWKRDEERDLDIREIVKVGRLYDVGPVVFPAYEGTQTGLRSLDIDGDAVPTPPATDAPEDVDAPEDTGNPERDAQAAEDEARLHRLDAIVERLAP